MAPSMSSSSKGGLGYQRANAFGGGPKKDTVCFVALHARNSRKMIVPLRDVPEDSHERGDDLLPSCPECFAKFLWACLFGRAFFSFSAHRFIGHCLLQDLLASCPPRTSSSWLRQTVCLLCMETGETFSEKEPHQKWLTDMKLPLNSDVHRLRSLNLTIMLTWNRWVKNGLVFLEFCFFWGGSPKIITWCFAFGFPPTHKKFAFGFPLNHKKKTLQQKRRSHCGFPGKCVQERCRFGEMAIGF